MLPSSTSPMRLSSRHRHPIDGEARHPRLHLGRNLPAQVDAIAFGLTRLVSIRERPLIDQVAQLDAA